MRWLPTLLLTLVGFPLNAFGQDQGFDDSILLSNTIIASSQSYQIKKLGCEFAGIFSRGNMESKNGHLTIEAKSEGGGFHCGHALDQNSLILGVSGNIQQFTMDAIVFRREELTTNYQPYLAFQLSPSFSLGISQEMETGEYKTQTGSYSASSHRLLLSGTWHQDQWEATVAYADRYRDTMVPTIDIPRSMDLSVRYQFSPLLTTAVTYTRYDFPGIANGSPLTVETSTTLVLASRITDELATELALIQTKNVEGDPKAKSQTIGFMGRYALNQQFKVGGFVHQYKGDSPDFDTNMSVYGFSLSMDR